MECVCVSLLACECVCVKANRSNVIKTYMFQMRMLCPLNDDSLIPVKNGCFFVCGNYAIILAGGRTRARIHARRIHS